LPSSARRLSARAAFLIVAASAFADAPTALPVDTVLAQHAVGGVLLVDVRDPADFARARIPGSINVPRFALSTRLWPRDATVVLVDAGLHDPALAALCRAESVGPSVRVLQGGLNLWQRRGGPIEGRPPALDALALLAPAAFLRACRSPDVVVLDTADQRDPRADRLLPESIHAPLAGDPARLVRLVQALTAGADGARVVLAFDRAGEHAASLTPALAAIDDAPVFYLTGGLDALERRAADAADGAGEGKDRRALRQRVSFRDGTSRNASWTRAGRGCGSCR
jgi:rhodanese-related sulfurtransferase